MNTSIDERRPMRLAWFRPSNQAAAHPFDDTPGLLRALSHEHDLHVFTETNAHDFVWQEFRVPYDVCVFELDNTPAHRFVWPYLLGYSGVLLLHARTLHNSRAHALFHGGRLEHYVAEFTFDAGHPPYLAHGTDYLRSDDWPMLRVPILASRVTVATHPGVAQALQDEYPPARVRCAPVPVQAGQPRRENQRPTLSSGAEEVVFGMLPNDRVDVVRRAFARAQDGSRPATLSVDSGEAVMQRADVILTLHWPGFGKPQTLALAAMGSGKPVIVLETEASADWPMLDPQTWRARGAYSTSAVGVSIDLRDEEHSLAVAIRRLASDETSRSRLGEAGRAWWQDHASVDAAVKAWRQVLGEAASLDRPSPQANWPAHLIVDGLERARKILGEFGVGTDVFERRPEVENMPEA
jgi:hypothetical protein